ncbi:MAG: biosynthetic-type acetolactate synthase large subunit [Candidatus Omnitrophica bacterium]|nr:biosynthetic-type acetolactate synthase large subunit [Candidatus Omnitrophota bacterium]
MKKTGADILVQCLLNEGVEIVFGCPGGANLPIYDAMYRAGVRHILVRHEQGGAHMADGYARATGKVGCCMATSGPGATNLVTGLGTANMDSVPVVAITGQVKSWLIGNDAFQEADVVGITRPVTKHNYLVKNVDELAQTIKDAFHIARTGRPGAVLVDIPSDVQLAETEFIQPREVSLPGYKPRVEGHPGQIQRAIDALNAAERPVLYVGGGAISSGACPELLELAEKGRIPVTCTTMGLGAFPGGHELSLGMLGMHGSQYANNAVQDSDLLIAVGARFDDRVTGQPETFAPQAKKIHIDIDPAAISKTVPVDIPIVGDVRDVLVQFNRQINREEPTEWLNQIEKWRRQHPLKWKSEDGKLLPQYVIHRISEMTQGNAIVASDVGQHQMWVGQYYRFNRPRHFLQSGGLGTMGFGLPAAIGAAFAGLPDPVVCISGDGSIQMCIQEFATAVYHRLPVKLFIINNGHLGMVRQWQELFYGNRIMASDMTGNPDFARVAEAYGAVGLHVEHAEEVDAAIDKALSTKDNLVVVDFIVEPYENVWPMVKPGTAINDMMGTISEMA